MMRFTAEKDISQILCSQYEGYSFKNKGILLFSAHFFHPLYLSDKISKNDFFCQETMFCL
jgi:hypothetical protein